ncbi:MAG TPA: A/G-specific adenine glycosylase [Ferruginibacter sp.]|nr:A/G-specific adenine glycosylase [Ferruginibacter sp.]HRE62175.1 A/G-specific adenine glycosylase [Ferruginibacter sp.]
MFKQQEGDFFTSILMNWHLNVNKRKMPWKGEKDPYKIWLSEIILQQTRVEQGWEYYERFIKKYPNIQKLAKAKQDDVFKLWEGLGYYSRCKNLHHTAQHISFELNGYFPTTYDTILNLKGVGPYTASAIASFAFNLPYAVVDGNVTRVLARFFGINKAVDTTEGKKHFSQLAQHLLHKTKPALYNQAIMDFGATVCKPQLPLCAICPFQSHCFAFKKNNVTNLPVKEKSIIKKNRWFYFLVITTGKHVFIKKRENKDIWQHLYEFVLLERSHKTNTVSLLTDPDFKTLLHAQPKPLAVSTEYKQLLTHQTIHAYFLKFQINNKKDLQGFEKFSIDKLKTIAFPKLINNYLKDIGWK